MAHSGALPIAIVTGSNVGVGFFTAKSLACRGYIVVIASRSAEKGEAAASSICEEARAKGSSGYAVFRQLDLASMHSVRAFSDCIRRDFPVGLCALILNAGMNSIQLNESELRTSDGFDITLQTNYLGHFLLARELMPLIRVTARTGVSPCRLVTLSSVVHRMVPSRKINWGAG